MPDPRLEEIIVWATSPVGMIVLGTGIAALVALEAWLLFRALRRRPPR